MMTAKNIRVNSASAWLLASRPKTLGAMFCPIMIGSAFAIAHGQFSWVYCVLILMSSLLLQILANLVNDYGDFMKGRDSMERLGPIRAMQMNLITKLAMKRGILITLFLAVFLSMPLVLRVGWPVVAAGLFGILLCFWYTLGEKPLSHLGFSELVIFIVFGPLSVVGAYYIQTFSVSLEVVLLSCAPGFLSSALMLTNNLRDRVEDRKNNKRTMAVRFGERFARITIVCLLLLTILLPVSLLAFSYSCVVLVPVVAMLPALRHVKIIVSEPISKEFNLMLAGIGQALYLFGALMFLGIICAAP